MLRRVERTAGSYLHINRRSPRNSEKKSTEEIRRRRRRRRREKSGARTALTGSSYQRTRYNRYSVISARSRYESSHYDRGFIGVHADHGGPASVFQTITGNHRIPASRRQQRRPKPLIIDPPRTQIYFCFDDRRYAGESALKIHFEFTLRNSG